jgi:uncharacterized protein with PIN domain
MLGGLARWLRILGYDTVYEKSGIPSELYSKSLAEDRCFLTRSNKLLHEDKAIVLRSERIEEQLAELKSTISLNLTLNLSKTRCATCNGNLVSIDREKLPEIFKKSHAGTIARFSNFTLCTNCDKIYWVGKHLKQIEETLLKAGGQTRYMNSNNHIRNEP